MNDSIQFILSFLLGSFLPARVFSAIAGVQQKAPRRCCVFPLSAGQVMGR